MMKIYQTRLGNLCTTVEVNGRPRRIQFLARDGVNGILSTEDEALQQALEKSVGYGRRFTLLDVSPGEEEPVAYTLVEQVHSWQEARDFLRAEPYNLTNKEVASSRLIERAAERLHLIFPNLKKGAKR